MAQIGSPAPASPSRAAPMAPAPEAESEVVSFRQQFEALASKADLLETKVNEVVEFHDGKKRGTGGRKAVGGDRSGGKNGGHSKGQPPDLFRQFAAILREYNAEGHPVHRMARTLLENFEQKWLRLLPKVERAEKQQMEGESTNNITDINTCQEAVIAKLTKETDDELSEMNKELKELWETVVQRCRKMTTDEKRKLTAGLYHLSQDDLEKALEIVAQDNPDFENKAEVDLDLDALSETTLWRLIFFVREALVQQDGKMNENAKRDACDSLARPSAKRIKKQP